MFFICGADFIKGMLDINYWFTENLKKFFDSTNIICFLRTKGEGGIT